MEYNKQFETTEIKNKSNQVIRINNNINHKNDITKQMNLVQLKTKPNYGVGFLLLPFYCYGL